MGLHNKWPNKISFNFVIQDNYNPKDDVAMNVKCVL
jgi:hypothetical protein